MPCFYYNLLVPYLNNDILFKGAKLADYFHASEITIHLKYKAGFVSLKHVYALDSILSTSDSNTILAALFPQKKNVHQINTPLKQYLGSQSKQTLLAPVLRYLSTVGSRVQKYIILCLQQLHLWYTNHFKVACLCNSILLEPNPFSKFLQKPILPYHASWQLLSVDSKRPYVQPVISSYWTDTA